MKIIYYAPELEVLCALNSAVLCASTGEAFTDQTTQSEEFYNNWE